MKKLLLIGAIALTLAFSITHSVQASSYEMICRVSSVQLQDGIYQTTVINENGDAWIVKADHDLTGQWINAHVNNHGTKTIEDDEIYSFDILED